MTHDHPRRRWAAALVFAMAVASVSTPTPRAAPAPGSALQLVVSGIPSLVDIQDAGDGSGRLFLVQQTGRIRILSGGSVSATPFLDISALVSTGGEQGLLGVAFHPQYSTNGVFFVHYTSPLHDDPAAIGRSVIARYRVSVGDPNVADPAGQILLTQDQPYANHNGGQIRFGPDQYLYIALGDGGGGGDPLNSGQNLSTMLGKILRIDVSNFASTTYSIPPDNPFVGGARPEIWAYGLRNPWRFSFDRSTGDLFIADVGQNVYEEVNLQPAGVGGRNYGWRKMEGLHCYESMPTCDFGTLPVIEYSHSFGCSVTGGFRYRGTSVPTLTGAYLFSDFCSGFLWAATPDSNGRWRTTALADTDLNVTAFGEDAAGEIYVADNGSGGRLFRLIAADSSSVTLSVSTSGTGSGRVSGNPQYVDCGWLCAALLPVGTTMTLSATPSTGSTFVGWTGDADCTDGIVTLTSDRACTALFGPGFTDDSLSAGVTTIKAVHVTELRTRVNAVRARYGLAAFAWSESSIAAGSTLIRAQHIVELRTALGQAYVAAGRSAPTFTDAALAAGDAIRAVHISELRSAVLALEQ